MRAEPGWVEAAVRLRPLSYKKIAARLGVSHNQVYYWLARRRKGEPRECRVCAEIFRPDPYNRDPRFCSQRCNMDWQRAKRKPETFKRMSRERRGTSNPNYKSGRQVGQNEREMRRHFNLALKGERECRNCGTDRNLQLHHAIPRSKCRATRMELLNGLPLCTDCHMGWHRRYRIIYRDVFTAEEWAFLSAVELTGEQIGPWLDERYPDRGHAFRDFGRVPVSPVELRTGG